MTKKEQKKKCLYIYRFLNKDNEVLYVGKTSNNLKTRMFGHFNSMKRLTEEQLNEINKIQYIKILNSFEWHVLEIFYINYFKAKYNKEFQCEDNDFNILHIEKILEKYKWKNFMCKKEILEMIDNAKNPYNVKGFLKTQKEEQLSIQQFNFICIELQKSKKQSDKISWLLLNLLAYSNLKITEILNLKWEDIENGYYTKNIPADLIFYYTTIINPNLNKIQKPFLIFSQKQNQVSLANICKKIKKSINNYYKNNYNSRSLKNIRKSYFSNKLNKEDILWLQEKERRY